MKKNVCKYFSISALSCLLLAASVSPSLSSSAGGDVDVEDAIVTSRYHNTVDHAGIQTPATLAFIGDVHHGHIYLSVSDDETFDPAADLPVLASIDGLRGLKLGRIGDIDARIPGLGWHGGAGHGASLVGFATRLRVLDLGLPFPDGRFKLTSAGSGFLSAFVNLEELNLRNHYITGGAVNLAGLVELRRLDLYNNKIGDSVAALSTLTKMEILDLGNNGNMPLAATGVTLQAMPALKEVDLSYLAGVTPVIFNGWFAPQIPGIRASMPVLDISRGFGTDFKIDYDDRHK